MRRLLFISILLLLTTYSAYAAKEIAGFLNPGVYIGWEFGEKSGFVLGGEISTGAIFANSALLVGTCGNLQYNFSSGNFKKVAEVEFGSLFGGISGGYEINSVGDNSKRISVWTGALAYLVFTYAPDATNPYCSGIVGKVPLMILDDESVDQSLEDLGL